MKIRFLLTSILLFGAMKQLCFAQFTLTGQSGNFLVPEARVIGDKKVAFGSSFHPQNEALLQYENRQGSHEIFNYVTLGFLPSIEITLNLTNIVNAPVRSGIGDRSANLRWLVKKETTRFPSIVLGAYVPLGVNDYVNSNFLVATKNFTLGNKNLTVTGGYGIPWVVRSRLYFDFDSIKIIRKEGTYQIGPMAAIRWELLQYLLVAAEYDGNNFNSGLILKLFNNHLYAKLYSFNFKTVGFGLSYSGVVK